MSELMDYARKLADEIGPRTPNSAQEQKASQVIAGWFKERDLDPAIEEFNIPTLTDVPYIVLYLLAVVAAVLGRSGGALGIVGLVLAIAVLLAFLNERYIGTLLGSILKKGQSQNVVARYIPRGVPGQTRRRKIIIVASYDSCKADPLAAPFLVNRIPLLQKVLLGCLVALVLLLVAVLSDFIGFIIQGNKTVYKSIYIFRGCVSCIFLAII